MDETKAPLLGEDIQPQPEQQQQQQQRRRRSTALIALVIPLAFFWLTTSHWHLITVSFLSYPAWSPCGGHGHGHLDAQSARSAFHLLTGVKERLAQASTSGVGDITKRLETLFLSIPSPESAKETLRGYTTVPHIAGGEADYQSALQVQEQWAQLLGAPSDKPESRLFDAGSTESIHYLTGDWRATGGHPLGPVRVWTDTYHTWLNEPKGSSSLSLGPSSDGEATWTADLQEDVLEDDPTSSHRIPAFHGYSHPGSASGPLVFAGYCSPSDFARLASRNIQVRGAITLCRYGGLFRGLKVRASAQAGAVGTLIFSDPIEDGNTTEANGHKAYPEGPARQKSSIQRGSVQALSAYPGDPGTPGLPSYKNASRLDPEKADSLPTIPSLPISYANAARLFEALRGKGVNTADFEKGEHAETWVGRIPGVDEYWTGPTKDEVVRMKNDMTSVNVKPIWNSYALIPGVVQDEVIVTGSHRDAWSAGAGDPSSGATAVHEVVAGFGALLKTGWRPLRSILVTSWDAEEYGLVGSTEFGEDYAKWLQDHAVAYLNTDVAAAGTGLKVGASPSLASLLRGAANEVEDPNGEGNSTIQVSKVTPLGSGSDYSVFLQHLGIASSDIGYAYSSAHADAVYHYHSAYDSFHWMERFGDPEFKHMTAIARLLGLATLRLADAVLLPISVGEYAHDIVEYVDKVGDIAKKSSRGGGCHGVKGHRNRVDFRQLKREATRLLDEAQRLERKKAHVSKEIDELLKHMGQSRDDDDDSNNKARRLAHLIRAAQRINTASRTFERRFIDTKGLKGRPWYRSLLVGPGRWLGYGATPLPGLTEAFTLDGGEGARREAKRIERALRGARGMLEKVGGGGKGGRVGRGHRHRDV